MNKDFYLSPAIRNSIVELQSKFNFFPGMTLFISLAILLTAQLLSAQDGPVISIWYGDEQTFGQHGAPQRWVNILGDVSDPDGMNSFYYTLNGGPAVALSIGPDNRRLQSAGDFNIDLATWDLIDGSNEVIITGIDNFNNQTAHTVTVNFSSTNVWSLPYSIDWQAKAAINDVAQAVDGKWEVTPDGIHTAITGYDRLVAIGDTTWADYEVAVPVKIHSINTSNGVGILLRWMGHTDYPVSCSQPKCGYLPLGAICWYRGNKIEIYGNGGSILSSQTRSLDLETYYMFKARVETQPGVGELYSFKVWKQSETEPVTWDITGQQSLTDPQNGSCMLISHHGDVTFGNLTVSPIPVSITNVQALVDNSNTSATISWSTNILASSQLAYGTGPGYELGVVSDLALKTSHSISLSSLVPNMEYHYQLTSETGTGDETYTGDLTFTTVASDIVSDDFHEPILNTSLWSFVDPVGDCNYSLVGSNTADAWLNIGVPAGTEHQLWTTGLKVPHVRQNCNDADFFEVEAKFESPLNLQFQEQGILVRQDDNTFLRFEFYSKSTETHAYVASFVLPGVTTYTDQVIGTNGLSPLYIRVKRQTNQWTMNYSTDGVTWSQAALFNFAMTVTGIGPYAGNATSTSSPSHTASVDYFFNTASPVDPEDPINENLVFITSTPVTEGITGQLYTYDVDAVGTPAPTYSLISAPAGMTIDSNTGLIEWIPSVSGDFNVSVEASNTIPSEDVQSFTIHVTDIPGGPVSDDFNHLNLDPSVWTFVDPLGGGGYTLTGTCSDDARINISVPGGSAHELWSDGIMAPHILQDCADTDFELELKFESSVSGAYQEQGLLIKENETHFLRFEFYSTASNTKVIAAVMTPGGSSTQFPLNTNIVVNSSIGGTGIAPLYLRVNRTGNQWIQSYSTNGTSWTVATTFSHTLVVSAVGTYAGNAGSSPPHTSSVDYFLNTSTPVSPEDAACNEWIGSVDSDWNNMANWSDGVTPQSSRNAIIPDVGNSKNVFPVINGEASCLDLIIETGAIITIGSAGNLTVHGTLQSDGSMVIQSDATSTGSLIDNGLIIGTGTNSIERYLSSNKWHYISAPVDDPTAQVFLGMYMMKWDEPSGEWSDIIDPNYVLSADMQGFAVWTYNPGIVTFSGDLNTGSRTMSTTNTFGASHDNKGFNFTGNPYPSAVNWNVNDGVGWTRIAGNIDPSVYIWNNSAGNYGVYVKDGASGTNGVDSIIPPHQGFFVHCNAATGSIGINNGARIHSAKDILKDTKALNIDLLKMKVWGNDFSDEVILQLNKMASTNFDSEFDGIKFFGEEYAPQLYSVSADDRQLSVNSFPLAENYEIIPLGLEVGVAGKYSISVESLTGFDITNKIQLEDLITGNIVTLNEGVLYNFSADPQNNPVRFLLHLMGNMNIDNSFSELLNIYSKDKTIFVEMAEVSNGEITLYSLTGQKISTTKITDLITSIKIQNAGCYIVSIMDNDALITRKIIVR